ncbi:unnamed protein product [Adineta steineri]|uniref:Uncharacterized protein n=1 Tax=Adineta steineri TaxID=433720 RepID=A0A814NAL4_9BILA|nr:unnamed protein product [Adineta steineri]CAF3788210.1 unnamed protein product [Adineta steineri]
MSVLVPSFQSSTNTHSQYFSTNSINENFNQSTKHMSLINRTKSKLYGDNHNNDHVPFGVVNSMKQRLLDKVNESLLNNNSTLIRHPLSKSASRLLSNESLIPTNSITTTPLKHTTRLSRSQDSLLNNTIVEQFTSYLQPKQDVIIVDTTKSNDENISIHRHSYTELNVDEVPKPGTVTTVKNMFERQIRLSRFDSDKLSHGSISTSSRVNNYSHREILSPSRSRSISPNDMAIRQRRTASIPTSIVSSSTTSLLPVPTSYPDLVISHTPPIPSLIELNKMSNEQSIMNLQNENKKFDMPLNEMSIMNSDYNRPNLLLTSNSSSDIADYQPIDFKSRLALFNHKKSTERPNEQISTTTNMKKPSTHSYSALPPPLNFLTKPTVHHHSEKKDIPSDDITRSSFISTTKAVTFYGGAKHNENIKSILPASTILPMPSIIKEEPSSILPLIDLFPVPDIIGGNIKLNKSSIFSGIKKDARVQFIDYIDTYEYPSFAVAMAEFNGTGSEDENDDDDDDDSSTNNDNNSIKTNVIDENANDQIDDELERLALINAKFNSNDLTEKPLQPKGSLHTFRPTHLVQYELGAQHDSLSYSNSSDIFSHDNYFSSTNNFTNHSLIKQQKTPFDMPNNIQWSSMSTTTDLLF